MRRVLVLSIISGLALGAAGGAMAQSRTVSTADMPKPGVSYIAGPTPVRRETVTTGNLPEATRLYVGGGSAGNNGYRDPAYDQDANDSDSSDGGYADGGYYGGFYDPGYQGGYRNGRGGRHDHDGYPGHGGNNNGHGGNNNHDHGRPPATSNSLAISTGPIKNTGQTNGSGAAFHLAPPPRNGNGNGNGSGNHPGNGNGHGNNTGTGTGYGTGYGTGNGTANGNGSNVPHLSHPITNTLPVRQGGWRVN